VWQRLVTPMLGGTPDEAVVAEALPRVDLVLTEFERILGTGPYFAGETLSLADLYLAPVFAYFTATPESAALLEKHPAIAAWWKTMSTRPSLAKTEPEFG
jgi:glutathione S-transferase